MRALRSALLPALALLGCSAGDSAPTAAAASDDGGQPRTPLAAAPFQVEPLATFDNPWAIAFLPDGAALMTEKGGRLKVWRAGQAARDVAGVPAVAARGQGGLLDIALSPRFATDKQVYLTYAEPQANGSGLALARAVLATDAAGGPRLDGLAVLWRDPEGGRGGQFGAIVAFSPDGHSLFLSSGERHRFTPAQDPSQPLGKILRLTLDGKPAPGNPWAGKTGAATVPVTDPPENTEVAKTAAGRPVAVPAPNLTPAQPSSTGRRTPNAPPLAPDGPS